MVFFRLGVDWVFRGGPRGSGIVLVGKQHVTSLGKRSIVGGVARGILVLGFSN